MSNYQLRVADLNGNAVFHAEQFGQNDWRYTGTIHQGLSIGTQRSIIAALAYIMSKGMVFDISAYHHKFGQNLHFTSEIPGVIRPDEMGNAWVNGRYMPSAEWLPIVIPHFSVEHHLEEVQKESGMVQETINGVGE